MENKILKNNAQASQQRSHAERMDRLFVQAAGDEDVSKREKNVKHFDLGANRHQAVIYAEPVHYMDGDETWKEIDNTLEETVNAQGRAVLKNRANRFHVEFPQQLDGGSMVSITDGERTFAWRFEQEARPIRAKIRTGAELKQARLAKQAQTLAKFAGRSVESLNNADLSAEIETAQARRGDIATLKAENTYEEALPGVSLRYTLNSESVKEDIILANVEALSRAAIRLPKQYDYAVDEAKRLLVKDKSTGDIAFMMNAPFVYDAAGRETIADVMLTDCGEYVRMEYVLDAAFIAGAQFPVTIDPVVHTSASYNNPVFNTLAEGAPNTNYSAVSYMAIGFKSGNEGVGLLKFNNLTGIAAGSTVIQAVVYLYPKSSSSSNYLAAHKVKSAWSAASSTWNTFNPDSTGNIEAEEIECVQCSSSSAIGFNITNLCRDWLRDSSTNHGIAIRSPKNISGDNYSELYSPAASSAYQPVMYVNYVSHAGIEDWWQYETHSAGRAGAVYADLFNGNSVVAHTDTVMNGNIMPVSVSHFYNSCLASANDFNCGYGWKTSLHQLIEVVDHNDSSYYVWIDGDGTRHYFLFTDFNSQPFEDCEGMGLKLTHVTNAAGVYTDDVITIEDKGHNKLIFSGVGYYKARLTSIKDAVGNAATISYDSSGRISKATDGAGRETVFTYNNSLLDNIRIPDTSASTYRYVYFTYDSASRLTGIRYSDLGGSAAHTVYSYADSNGYQLLTRMRNFDGIAVNIAYDSAKRVASLEDVALNSSGAVINYGSKQIIEYKNMETHVTAVETTANNTGKKLYYQFNDSGNVVSVHDDLGFGSFTKFESGIDNRPSQTSRLRRAVVNLLRKPDWTAGWSNNKNGSTIQITVDNETRCLGMPGGKFINTAGTDGYCRQQVTIEKGRDYTMSCYMKLNSVTGNGAYLRISPVTGGAFTAQTSAYRNGSTAAALGNGMGNDGWERFYFTFNIPGSGTVNAYFEMGTNATGGSAWLCCPQLEIGAIANPFNLIGNGDFHLSTASGSRNLPTDWTEGSNVLQNTGNGVMARTGDSTIPSHLSGKYVQLEGVPNKAYICYTQQINMAGKAGDAVVLGGWAKGQAIPDSDNASQGFGLAARIKKTDGSWSDYWFCPFNEEWTSWQYACFGAPCKYDYTMIEIGVAYNRNCNSAKFTNIFLHREEFGQTYAYDENKNPVSTRSLASQQSNASYDSADNMTSYVQGGRDASVTDNKYIFYYGGTDAERQRHLLLRSCTPMRQTDYFSYDGKGNRTSSRRIDFRVYSENAAENAFPYIRSETTYTSDGNYPLSSKDARGNTVTKATNLYDGTLSSATDPTGQAVNYSYDPSKRVTAVTASADGKNYRNTYSYANDRISQVSHNTTGDTADVTYSFAYDSLGRKTTVKAGSQTLSTNAYENDRSGLLSSVTYGNGGKVAYTYDEFDRITGISVDNNETPCYTYEYGANGRAARVKDSNLGRTLETEYDLADRPCRSTIKDNGGNIVYRSTLCYDKFSNPVQLREDVNGAHVTDYTYDRDNRVTRAQFASNSNYRVDNTYDALGRLSGRTATNGAAYATTFSYVGGGYGTNSTTPMVSGITQNGMNFSYAYDSRGNITAETRNGATTGYVYDGIGQLIRVNDPHENATWVYNYDRGGNITSKVKYAYTTGNLGSAVQTISYSYDSAWKDKLVSYDGTSITYDAIGNPLNDGTWTYTWEKGRQLKQMSKSGTTVQFNYDHNGIRTQKAVNVNGTTTTTNYIYNGNKLVHLTQGNNWLHFYYSGQSPAMVNLNGTLYTYVKNLQGDIVAILNNAGSIVVEYKYDAWGRPLSSTGSMAGTLGYLNPFRYRGYTYDEETQYIWLVKRYYNPIIQRFINADTDIGSIGCILMHNILAYSLNNPIMRIDTSGKRSRWFTNATENEVLSEAFSELPAKTRLKHTGAGSNAALAIILAYHDCIEQSAEEFGIEPEMIEAVLYRELICVGVDDIAGEWCYKLFGRECSTGIGQIKPTTAIAAETTVYGSCNKTVSQMYDLLQDDCTNIRYVAMNLKAITMKNDIEDGITHKVKDFSSTFLTFARYNSTELTDRAIVYATATLNYYEAFKSIRKVH